MREAICKLISLTLCLSALCAPTAPAFAQSAAGLMDEVVNLALVDQALLEKLDDGLRLSVEREPDTVSVATWEELTAALENEQDISIDGDIEAEEAFSVDGKTLWIAEGVTLRFHDASMPVALTNGAMLVNDGTLVGSVALAARCVLYNGENGVVTEPKTSKTSGLLSIRAEENCVIVNHGVVNAGGGSRLLAGSLMVNAGELGAYDLTLSGSNLFNAGRLTLPEKLPNGKAATTAEGNPMIMTDGAILGLYNGSVLYNTGALAVQQKGSLLSYGRVINEGVVELSGYRDWQTLEGLVENRGVVRVAENANINGTVFGPGVYDGLRDDWNGLKTFGSAIAPQDAGAVSDADELTRAMRGFYIMSDGDERMVEAMENADAPRNSDEAFTLAMEAMQAMLGTENITFVIDSDTYYQAVEEAEPVILTGNVTLTAPLEVTRPLYIMGSLKADEGATITVHGVPVVLCEGGSLEVSRLELHPLSANYEGPELSVGKDSSLTVRPGGTLLLGENSILDGQDGNVSIEGASLLMEGGSVFAPDRLASFNADDAEITVGDSAWFMPPYRNAFVASGLRLTQNQGGWAVLPSDTELTGAQITIIEAPMRVTGANVVLHDCEATMKNGGSITFINSRLSLTGTTRLVNEGRYDVLEFFGWDEYWVKATDEAGIVNNGEVYMSVASEFETPVDNKGTFYYDRAVYGDEGFTAITGNRAKVQR